MAPRSNQSEAGVCEQLPRFSEKLQVIRDERISLWQDIQQLYVLHVNEKYKNAYLSKLRGILSSGLSAILAAAAIAAVAQYLVNHRSEPDFTATNNVHAISWVKYEGAICAKSCWLLRIQTSNKSNENAQVQIDGIGTKCLELPGSVFLNPMAIKSHTTQKISAYLACGASSPVELTSSVQRCRVSRDIHCHLLVSFPSAPYH